LRRPLGSAQYTSIDYGQTLDDHGVMQSVGSVGDAYDNALAESFVDSFKTELIADRVCAPAPSSSSQSSNGSAGSTTTASTKRSTTARLPSSRHRHSLTSRSWGRPLRRLSHMDNQETN
jgi:transposase InsO family protein